MHILHVINSLSCGGAEVFTANLCATLSRKHKVTLLIYAGILDEIGHNLKDLLETHHVSIISLNIKNNFLKLFIPFIFAFYLKRLNPDIVHAHLDQSEFFISLAIKLLIKSKKPKLVRTLHNTRINLRINKVFQRYISKTFDGTIACSKSVYLSKHYKPYEISNFIPINNGINTTELIRSHHLKNYYRTKFDIPNDSFVFLCIGSFTPRGTELQKSQDLVLQSISRIRQTNNLLVLFLGDGSSIEQIKSLSLELRIADKCRFEGVVSNVYQYMIASDVLLMPSRFEGLPIAGIESVCIGLPIIVSNIAAFYDIAFDNSVICEKNNVESLANSMQYAINNYSHINKHALKLSKKFINELNIETTTDKYLGFYWKLKSQPLHTS